MENEKRLIDANALLDSFRKHMVEHFDRERCASEEHCKLCERGCLWRNKVNEATTVDAVEVVRCKDCKYCTEVGLPRCRITGRNMTDDDFCSRGERRAGE